MYDVLELLRSIVNSRTAFLNSTVEALRLLINLSIYVDLYFSRAPKKCNHFLPNQHTILAFGKKF